MCVLWWFHSFVRFLLDSTSSVCKIGCKRPSDTKMPITISTEAEPVTVVAQPRSTWRERFTQCLNDLEADPSAAKAVPLRDLPPMWQDWGVAWLVGQGVVDSTMDIFRRQPAPHLSTTSKFSLAKHSGRRHRIQKALSLTAIPLRNSIASDLYSATACTRQKPEPTPAIGWATPRFRLCRRQR